MMFRYLEVSRVGSTDECDVRSAPSGAKERVQQRGLLHREAKQTDGSVLLVCQGLPGFARMRRYEDEHYARRMKEW